MEEHHIDVVSVQSFYRHGRVATEASYVRGVCLIEDVVSSFIFSLNATP